LSENTDILDFELTTDQITTVTRMDMGASLFLDYGDAQAATCLGTGVVE
jgi:hypothetical protein